MQSINQADKKLWCSEWRKNSALLNSVWKTCFTIMSFSIQIQQSCISMCKLFKISNCWIRFVNTSNKNANSNNNHKKNSLTPLSNMDDSWMDGKYRCCYQRRKSKFWCHATRLTSTTYMTVVPTWYNEEAGCSEPGPLSTDWAWGNAVAAVWRGGCGGAYGTGCRG